MITKFFPGGFTRYLSLPILGPVMDSYAAWLHEQQYTWRSARYELRMAGHVADYLKRRAVRGIQDLDHHHLDECHRWFRHRFPQEAGSVLVLLRFLEEGAYINRPPPSAPLNAADVHVLAFMEHLEEVRGFAPSTIRRQVQIASEFLAMVAVGEIPRTPVESERS